MFLNKLVFVEFFIRYQHEDGGSPVHFNKVGEPPAVPPIIPSRALTGPLSHGNAAVAYWRRKEAGAPDRRGGMQEVRGVLPKNLPPTRLGPARPINNTVWTWRLPRNLTQSAEDLRQKGNSVGTR